MPELRNRELEEKASLEDKASIEGARALHEEQEALRAEVERLRQQKQELLAEIERQEDKRQSKDGGSADHGSGERQKETGNSQPRDRTGTQERQADEGPAQKEKPEKDDGAEGKEDEDKKGGGKPPKPPLRQRIGGWVRRHPVATVLIIVGAIAVIIGGLIYWRYLESYVDTDDAEVDGNIHQIGSRVNGTVIGVYVENNRSVVQNQTLVDLDPRDYQAALSQAQANLTQAISALHAQAPNVPITQTTETTNVATTALEVANAQAALDAARQSYQSALAELRQAQVNEANAKAEEERYRRMADKQEVSREVYDQRATDARSQAALVAARQASADAAEKAIAERQSALNEAQERNREVEGNLPRQIAVQHATVDSRQAGVLAARAQVAQAELNLSYCKILAPLPGIVGDKSVTVGQQVAPGQELLAITDVRDLWVTANFKETEIRNMRPGQGATIHVDAIDRDFDGYVQNMPGATGARYSLLPPENATGNYVKVVQRLPIRIRLKPGQPGFDRLRPGMSVEPKVWLR